MEYDHLAKRRRKSPFRKFVRFFFLCCFVLGGIFVWRVASFNQESASGQAQNPPPAEEEKFTAINGMVVPRDVAARRPLGVMVENHTDARPQSGLSKADVVYEVLAEGGITRYLALFQSHEVNSIGPVRSARDYYAELANSWGALFAHVGGSPEVLQTLEQGGYPKLIDINEYYNGKYFQRKPSRFAPHNVYTSTANLNNFLKDKKRESWQKPSKHPFTFKDEQTVMEPFAAKTINISFSLPSFAVRYEYDSSKKVYNRFLAGKKDMDADSGAQIVPKTVIVQMVRVTEIPNDPALRINIDLGGGGKAYVFMDGQVIEGTWQKQAGGNTAFLDGTGKEIAINPGQVWVELVPTTKQSELNWKPSATPPPAASR